MFIISQVTFHRDSAWFIILLLEILIASYEVNIKHRSLIFIIFLAIALAISVVLNLILFSTAKQYYAQLNGARLDPLALSAFPVSETVLGQPGANAKRIVFFGDSRAAMWPAPVGMSGYEFVNRGIGSQTSSQVLARYDFHVKPLEPQVLILQVGINDLKTIPLFPEKKDRIVSDCKNNIERIVTKALQQNSFVILTTIFPEGNLPLERAAFWSEDVGKAVTEVNQFIFAMEGDRVAVFDTAKIIAGGNDLVKKEYQKDFLHVNEAGYATLNEQLRIILSDQNE